MQRLLRAALVALLALGAAIVSSAPARSAGASTISSNPLATSGGTGPIQHVIVIIQSGHSFDNYFGTRAGVEGIPAKVCLPTAANSTVCVKPYPLNPDEARAGLLSTLSVTRKAVDNGKMDGFVSAQPNGSIGTLAMGHLTAADLPYYSDLASRFTLMDNFFATSQAGALPNRLAAVSGTDGGLVSNTVPTGGIKMPTVFDQLAQKGETWKYYVQNYTGPTTVSPSEVTRTPLLAMPSVTQSAQIHQVVDISQYFHDIDANQLPAVSYISSSRADSEQSPQSSSQGEAFVSSVLDALMQSPTWYHTAVLLTYDDSGGWYDHQAPPVVAGTRLGIRVPAMLISPYARAGYVDHTQFQTASIPDFIDQVFGMAPLNADAAGSSLLGALDLHQLPISPAIDRGAAATLVRPKVLGVYVLYLGALLAAALLIVLAFARMRRLAAAATDSGAAASPPAAGHPSEAADGSEPARGTEPPAEGETDGGPADERAGAPIEISLASDSGGGAPTAPVRGGGAWLWHRPSKRVRPAPSGDLLA